MRRSVLLALLLSLCVPVAASAAPGSVTRVAPAAWAHRSAYALSAADAAAHPEWVLGDAAGDALSVGSSYAADVGDPAYRAWWIDRAAAAVGGTRGLYIDDVTMERRFSGTARDPRTGSNLSESAWQRYMADFMVAVRGALPSTEIVHEVVWTAWGWNVRRELAAADAVALERGFRDPAITGPWEFHAFLAFVEARQAAGQDVVLGAGPGQSYTLATYLLADRGAASLATTDAWTGYGARLGAPAGSRYGWSGVWRRDFADGMVLVNPPGAAARTLRVGAGYRELAGAARATVTLPPGSGAVLARMPVAPPQPPPPVVQPPPVVIEPPAPAPPAPLTTQQRPGQIVAHTAGARGPVATRTTARLSRRRVHGRVRGARGGSVRVTVQRR
ncbi:MAG TPA: putative glycoside hydrolase, partial [Solirubrobacter sp.]|nr:putative glycoside hydrolase [Solirubrobacter sp.]